MFDRLIYDATIVFKGGVTLTFPVYHLKWTTTGEKLNKLEWECVEGHVFVAFDLDEIVAILSQVRTND